MKRMPYLLAVATLMLSACTPMDIVREAAWSMGAPARAADVNPDELYWNPAVISQENCPEINGKFLIPPMRYSGGFFITDVPDVKTAGKKIVPIEFMLSVERTPEGIKARAQSEVGDLREQRMFGKRFGCANGEYVVRGFGFYTGGGETITCVALTYYETHWRLDQERNLVVNKVQRNPCWLDRGKNVPSKEFVFPKRVFKRIGDAALD